MCYKKTKEKGQGSEDDMVRLKRVKEESVRDFGISYLYLIFVNIANDIANPKPRMFRRQSRWSIGSQSSAVIMISAVRSYLNAGLLN